MQFVVRYWSAKLPDGHRAPDGSPRMLDYSTHPATKLGLHSALLSHHDRTEILASHGAEYLCEVFVMEGEDAYVLTQEVAVGLFYGLPDGELKWTTIQEFLLPQERRIPQQLAASHERQLQLFEYTHAPYDDVAENHHLNIDA